jgi:hypothetical protein
MGWGRTTFEIPESWQRDPVGERRTEELAARRVCIDGASQKLDSCNLSM